MVCKVQCFRWLPATITLSCACCVFVCRLAVDFVARTETLDADMGQIVAEINSRRHPGSEHVA